MAMPILTRPVTRPHFVEPATCVDLEHGGFDTVWRELIFGANYNDPAPLRYPGYSQVMSSMLGRWRL